MFPREHRLRLEKDIKALLAKGRGVFDACVGLKVRRNDVGITRFAVVVGTKVSKSAVDRNRVRRQVREAARLRIPMVKPGFDVMFLVRREALGKPFSDIDRRVEAGLRKAGLL